MIEFENIEQWDLKAMRQSYEDDGYVQGGKLLTDASIDILNDKVDRYLDICRRKKTENFEALGDHPDTSIFQLGELWKSVDEVADIVRSPILARILGALNGEKKFQLFQDQLQYKPAKIGGVNSWHQEIQFRPFQEPFAEITGWIALDDITEENGCMRMVPRSHKWGTATCYLTALKHYLPLDDQYLGNKIEVQARCMPKGHVHFHHHLAWHGSGLNMTDAPRRALAFHFIVGDVIYEPKFGYTLNLEPGQQLHGDEWPAIGSNFKPWGHGK